MRPLIAAISAQYGHSGDRNYDRNLCQVPQFQLVCPSHRPVRMCRMGELVRIESIDPNEGQNRLNRVDSEYTPMRWSDCAHIIIGVIWARWVFVLVMFASWAGTLVGNESTGPGGLITLVDAQNLEWIQRGWPKWLASDPHSCPTALSKFGCKALTS